MTTTPKSTAMAQHFDEKILKITKKQQGIATSGSGGIILLTTFEDSKKLRINATKSTNKKSKQVLENLLELEKIRS